MKYEKRKYLIFCLAFCAFALFLVPHVPALADDNEYMTYVKDYENAVQTVYTLGCTIALPLAAVAVAFGAFRMVTGDEDSVRKGKRDIVLAVLAVVAIMLLPRFVNMGVSTGREHAWEPETKDVSDFQAKYYGETEGDSDEEEENTDKEGE